MRFTPTAVPGPTLVDLELREDERGFFARTFCREEFVAAGLDPMVEQCNLSYTRTRGTLRGMHYQLEPAPEAKFLRVVRGAILDVVVDLRPGSPTRLQHVAVELTAENRRGFYIPPYFAHGFQTLADDTEVVYQMSRPYTPGVERGIRYDDPALGLDWPLPVTVISEKDLLWPPFKDE